MGIVVPAVPPGWSVAVAVGVRARGSGVSEGKTMAVGLGCAVGVLEGAEVGAAASVSFAHAVLVAADSAVAVIL